MTDSRDYRVLLANAAIGVVGDTGSGKTTLLATLAEYVYRTYQKVTRLYSYDPGGYGDLMASLIRKGIVQLWRVRTRDPDGSLGLATGTCDLASKGYWPAKRDPLTGDTEPAAALVAPFTSTLTMRCKEGHEVISAPNQAGLQGPARACPTCKVLVSLADCGEVVKKLAPVGGFEKVGCLMHDGGTSMSDWVMSDMNQRAGRDELGGVKGNMRTQLSSGLTYGVAGMSGVGFAQNRAQDWINFAIAVPGMVVPPVFTFLEHKATDDGLVIYGPKIAGSARTGDVPGWLGNCWNAAIVAGSDGKEHRLYLQSYKLPQELGFHLCKSRAAAGTMPEYLVDPKGATLAKGDAYSQFNLGTAYELLLSALSQTDARADSLFPNAPGLDSGTIEAPAAALQKAGAPVAGQVVGRLQAAQKPATASPAAQPAIQPAAKPTLMAAPKPAAPAAVAQAQVAAPGSAPAQKPNGPGAPKPPAAAPIKK